MRKGRTFFISFEKKKQYEADIFFVSCVCASVFPFISFFFGELLFNPFSIFATTVLSIFPLLLMSWRIPLFFFQ